MIYTDAELYREHKKDSDLHSLQYLSIILKKKS